MNTVNGSSCDCAGADVGRRSLLKSGLGLGVVGVSLAGGLPAIAIAQGEAGVLTREQRDRLPPAQVINLLKQGNERFRTGKMQNHNYLAQKRATANGQYPAAVILSCIDSRAPAEIVLDAGIGDTFNARVAGNVNNDDVLGSLEFSCALAGAKVILVMAHTACGAIRGAINGAELGHLTGLLDKIKPSIAATKYTGERSGDNGEFVDAVARTNVYRTIEDIRQRSEVLSTLEKEGKIKIVGSVYHLVGGRVEFLD